MAMTNKRRIHFTAAAIFAFAALLSAQSPGPAAQPVSDGNFRTLLQTLTFEFNSAAINPSSFESLDSIAALFQGNRERRYEIQGHSDSLGSAAYNMHLSAARAMMVKSYIVQKGVPSENIIATGYGMQRPVAGNSTESDRAANRRVEIILIESQEEYEALKEAEMKMREDVRQASIRGYDPSAAAPDASAASSKGARPWPFTEPEPQSYSTPAAPAKVTHSNVNVKPTRARTDLEEGRFSMAISVGPTPKTDLGMVFLGGNLGVGAIDYELGFLFYPGVSLNMYKTGAANDTSAAYWGFQAAAGYSYVRSWFVWSAGPALVIDRGGLKGDKKMILRGALQSKIDVRVIPFDNESYNCLRLGYRMDAFPKKQAPLFGAFKSNTDVFAVHTIMIGYVLMTP